MRGMGQARGFTAYMKADRSAEQILDWRPVRPRSRADLVQPNPLNSTSSAAHLLIDRAQALRSHPQLGVGQVTPDLTPALKFRPGGKWKSCEEV